VEKGGEGVVIHAGTDVYDLVCERDRRINEIATLPPAERIEALSALQAKIEAAQDKGMILGNGQIGRALEYALSELKSEGAILAKLQEKGVPLESPDDDLRRAFAETVRPTGCFLVAREMRDRMRRSREPVQGKLL